MSVYGDRIKAIRERNGVTQQALAEAASVLRLTLGHETLEMAITYMHMAAHDVQAVQRNVSPADAVFNTGKRK